MILVFGFNFRLAIVTESSGGLPEINNNAVTSFTKYYLTKSVPQSVKM
jgi:hypothetical protein